MNVKIIILVFIFLNDAIADDNLNIKLYDKLDMKFKSIPGSGPPEVENAKIQCSNEHNLNKGKFSFTTSKRISFLSNKTKLNHFSLISDLADENLFNDAIEISQNEKCYWKCVLKNMGSVSYGCILHCFITVLTF